SFVGHVNFLFAPVFAWIICTPKYLTGGMPLGEVTQVAAAFVTVQAALNWLVDNYQRLADWTSSVNRVSSLLIALDQIDRDEYPRNHRIIRVEAQQALAQYRETVTVDDRPRDTAFLRGAVLQSFCKPLNASYIRSTPCDRRHRILSALPACRCLSPNKEQIP